MGLFSWDCICCGHSVLHTADYPHGWQERMVVSTGGPWVVGNYDGYGRVDGEDVLAFGQLYTEDSEASGGCRQTTFPVVMHEACWEAAGKPEPGGLPASRRAYDQGHRNFHNIERPAAGDFVDRKKWNRPPGAETGEGYRPCACDAEDEDQEVA